MKVIWWYVALAIASCTGENIEVEVEELFEMMPYEQMMSLGMEYAMSDPQVKALMQYISSPQFKKNVLALQSSEEFARLADIISPYKIDAYSLANKCNSALDMPLLSHKVGYERVKRSPGDGVSGLVMEVVGITPIEEMKEAYKYKIAHNPQFKMLMEQALSDNGRRVLESFTSSPPLQEIRADLVKIGIPVNNLVEYFEKQFHKFFFDVSPTSATSYITV